ncbi:response regulator [Cohnella lubricantis]|uniref:Response regulator n=1 Tax=Cohnella lubricantis TaxID=2163172 RepID=A0A841TCT0_9BACL|nr:response regulator [Cohnella lubricantis]MBB6679114.1 response regulator [Cohnella lubricantis]MBP2120193.1 YesN/AraC family two-component response regulator [Cohnella lubricantis]
MYTILLVDDEPLICKGLGNLLQNSGLAIGTILTAGNGQEALDYLRLENVDLLITDIQMGTMSGIELMHQAKIIKPWVETIVISAHETFQYAQMAMRLGAKDYLIKPLNNEHFLDIVRNVLLKIERPVRSEEGAEEMSGMRGSFHMTQPDEERNRLLNELMACESAETEKIAQELKLRRGMAIGGPYFAVIRMRLLLDELAEKDKRLLQYAALNIASELLGQEWSHQAFYSRDGEMCVLLDWSERTYEELGANRIEQLEFIGRSLFLNIEKYLGIRSVVGISQMLRDVAFIPLLSQQAGRAMRWNEEHRDHYIFYYGDYKWAMREGTSSEEEWVGQSNIIVEQAKQYIEENFCKKGITLNEVARHNHVSPNYLSYLFKKYMHCNLWEYVIKLRMEESRRLILTTDLRRYEIADRVGYESPEHFSKIFKKYYGISPTELKK